VRGGCYRNCDAEVDVTAAGVSNWSAYIYRRQPLSTLCMINTQVFGCVT
jgi:hypothetical protein